LTAASVKTSEVFAAVKVVLPTAMIAKMAKIENNLFIVVCLRINN
jgi:hypothetical protein